jgi:hypothetical protein
VDPDDKGAGVCMNVSILSPIQEKGKKKKLKNGHALCKISGISAFLLSCRYQIIVDVLASSLKMVLFGILLSSQMTFMRGKARFDSVLC